MSCCNICGKEKDEPIYISAQNVSISSLCQVLNVKTIIHYCKGCSHLQTTGIEAIDQYYDNDYKILNNSEEEDQLYEVVEGKKIYRTEHQINTLLKKYEFNDRANVLDYGAAKGSVLKGLLERRPGINVYLFDVTESYLPFWREFASPDQWSTYTPKESWEQNFDLITSFFVLEHVKSPGEFLNNIRKLLRDEGTFYCIVPNVYQNIADFVVVDHINHFSIQSITYLFESSGFEIIEIDEASHQNCYIIVAIKSVKTKRKPLQHLDQIGERVSSISKYWADFSGKIVQLENKYISQNAAIYGAGFYGTFIYTCLNHIENIQCIVDQNPYLQGREMFGLPIVSPEQIYEGTKLVYIGLNPTRAKSIINEIIVWKEKELNFLFV